MILKGNKIRVPLFMLFAVYIKVLLRLTTVQKKGALYIIYNYIYFLSNHLPSKGSPILT